MSRREILKNLYMAYDSAMSDFSNLGKHHGQLEYILVNLEWVITRLDMYYATDETDRNALP